ncbi:hypothetical protein M9434_004417 [Picochlorum sp. BPE23]|nr:hypothetical protein M9434_004417 [Picochlorum sp. BPE23]
MSSVDDWAQGVVSRRSPPPPPPPSPPPPPPPPGALQYTVVNGYFADNTAYFHQNGITVLRTGQVTSIPDINLGTGGYIRLDNWNERYSVQWLGYFRAPTTGSYTFYTNSDDASYLWIGSSAIQGYTTANALINNGGTHGMREVGKAISLDQGTVYRLRIQFGENTGGDNMIVSVTPPGGTETTDLAPFLAYTA